VQPLLPKVDRVLASAGDPGCTPSQLALAYCLQNPQVSSLLFGARRVVRMSDNLGALALVPRPTPDVLAALRTL
jgi:aryl-alcohol dehydrogenase-like predicted oxidoreductase